MNVDVMGGDAYPMLKVSLKQGETVKAESGAMVAMSQGLVLSGKVDGGVGKAIGRLFSGESFFMQEIEAKERDGWVMLASSMPGAIGRLELDGTTEWQVEKKGFLAGTPGVDVSTKMQGITKGLFSGEGFFVVKISGTGSAFLSTYGSLQVINLADGEEVLIDNGHLVAWEATIDYKISKGAKSWTSSFTSGEGVACRFTGPGKVLIQTRNPSGFAGWLYPYLPIPKKG